MATKKIVIVAGEASGDLHASELVLALKEINNTLQFFGLGGEKMKEAGVEIYYNLTDLAVVGFIEVLKNLRTFRRIFNALLIKIDEAKPDLAILVDYPGFNLQLAKALKKRNIPVIYYISPQVWAWGKNRIKLIKKIVKKMLVIFKFEEELYKRNGVDAEFVGHPLLDTTKITTEREDLLKELNIPLDSEIVALLPGSREKEVKRLLPIMLNSAKIISSQIPNSCFLILKSSTLKSELFEEIISAFNLPLYILENRTYDGINASSLAIVASGTATLETAILERPMVIVYKVSFLSGLYLKWALRIPCVGLVNVVFGKKIIPECLQYNATPKNIAKEALNILKNPLVLNEMHQELSTIKSKLGSSGASKRAAEIIYSFL